MKKHLTHLEKEIGLIFSQNLQPKGEFTYNSFTKKLAQIISSNKEIEASLSQFERVSNQGRGIFCGSTIKFGDLSFECLDCRLDENALLCKACFQASSHSNHRISYSTSRAGYCDCGDKAMMKSECIKNSLLTFFFLFFGKKNFIF